MAFPPEKVNVAAPDGFIVKDCPMQMAPELTVMVGEGLTVTASVWAGEEPQLLYAVREKIPEAPAVADMVFVVEVPVQPPGNVHV